MGNYSDRTVCTEWGGPMSPRQQEQASQLRLPRLQQVSDELLRGLHPGDEQPAARLEHGKLLLEAGLKDGDWYSTDDPERNRRFAACSFLFRTSPGLAELQNAWTGPARPQARAVARGTAAPAPAVRGPATVPRAAARRVTPAGLGRTTGTSAGGIGGAMLEDRRRRRFGGDELGWPRRLDRRAQAARAAAREKREARRAGSAARPASAGSFLGGASVGPAVRLREAAEQAKETGSGTGGNTPPADTNGDATAGCSCTTDEDGRDRPAGLRPCSSLPSARGSGDGSDGDVSCRFYPEPSRS